MSMDSSAIPGDGKRSVRDKAAFHRRIDSNNEEEFLKEAFKVKMAISAIHQAFTDAFCLRSGAFSPLPLGFFGLDLFLLEGKVILRL